MRCRGVKPCFVLGCGLILAQQVFGQIDPFHRNLLQLGYDEPIVGHGPQGVYLYYYYNNPEICRTNTALRAAIAPAYLDGEVGFKELLSPYTDLGVGLYGGAFSDNYYEVQQGKYWHEQSFDGYGGGTALSIYQLLNPGRLVPLNLVLRAGAHYTTYDGTKKTASDFVLPESRANTFLRVGLRFGGKEPVLHPDLGLELSVWFARLWRSRYGGYGYDDDRSVEAATDVYWAYAGLNYAWTNIGHRISFAVTAGNVSNPDRFSAWRPGGVLPLAAEFPLMLPGYYYQELSAKSVVHIYASYLVPLDRGRRFQFGLEVGTAYLDYLAGLAQSQPWQTGAGCNLIFTPRNRAFRIVLRYGYGFNAERDNGKGAQSVGVLFQYDFEKSLQNRRRNL